jgi:TldD protein
MPTVTRRHFLATSSLAAASTVLAPRVHALSSNIGRSPLSANALLADPLTGTALHTLAAHALDAAKAGGASYADVRVAERHWLRVGMMYPGLEPAVELMTTFEFGVRLIADGAWAFVHGSAPTSDSMAAAARNAITMAKGYGRTIKRRVELASAPVVTGEWANPIKEDPFAVPIRDQGPIIGALHQAVLRVPHIAMEGSIDFNWTRETRAFASSEGSRITQVLRRSIPKAYFDANHLFGRVVLPFSLLDSASAGFEAVSEPSLQDSIKHHAEQVVGFAALPHGTLDVGRYPVVCDGRTLGMLLTRTLGSAAELDRVLGFEADASGTSFLSPATDILGTEVANPAVTVTCHRSLPSIVAARWDDEGVETRAYPLITAGKLVDYHCSRQTIPTLASWYQRQGLPLRPQGCMVAPDASDPVLIRPGHLAIAPAVKSAATVEELCQEVGSGILVLGRNSITSDQQLGGGSLTMGRSATDGIMLEIVRGKPVRRLEDNGLQFSTSNLWKKQLITLGAERTLETSTFEIDKGMPWRPVRQSATAPAGVFKDVNVIATNIRF